MRARALDAALKNCKPPAFSSPHAAVGNGGAGVGGVAGTGAVSVGVVGGVTIGEKFNNSALHNGLQLFIARLLRPFWFRVVVTCKGGSGPGVRTKRSADGQAKGGGDVSLHGSDTMRGSGVRGGGGEGGGVLYHTSPFQKYSSRGQESVAQGTIQEKIQQPRMMEKSNVYFHHDL